MANKQIPELDVLPLAANNDLLLIRDVSAVEDKQIAVSALLSGTAPSIHGHTMGQISGLGTAAAADVGDFATASQGSLANSAVQPGDPVSSLTNDLGYVDAPGAAAASPVQSVNGYTGIVSLGAADVGAAEASHVHVLSDITDAGTAASYDVGDFATAAQGDLADTAVQPGDLAAVATSGQYSDLSGLPSLGSAAGLDSSDFATAIHTHVLSDITDAGTAAGADTGDFATAAQGDLADTAVQPGDLAAVATSGQYSDLSGLPSLGTAAAANTGDFATAAQGALADTAAQVVDLTYPNLIVVSPTGDDMTGDGSFPKPLATLQAAYDVVPDGIETTIVLMPGVYVGDLTVDDGIKNTDNLSIVGLVGSGTTHIIGTIQVLGAVQGLKIKDVDIEGQTNGVPTLHLSGTAGKCTLSSVRLQHSGGASETILQIDGMASGEYVILSCRMDGKVLLDEASSATYLQTMGSSPQEELTVQHTGWFVQITNVVSIRKINHSDGIVRIVGISEFALGFGDAIVSTADSTTPTNLLVLSHVNMQNSSGTYLSINKTGDCNWLMDSVNREPFIDTLMGGRLYFTARVQDVGADYNPDHYIPSGDSVRDHLEAIDDKIVYDFTGTTRPVSPVEGQRFVDTSLSPARPIWYISGQWVDATGTTV